MSVVRFRSAGFQTCGLPAVALAKAGIVDFPVGRVSFRSQILQVCPAPRDAAHETGNPVLRSRCGVSRPRDAWNPISTSFALPPVVPLACLVVVCLLAGCKVGPDYIRPAPLVGASVPAAYAEAATNAVSWQTAAPAAHLPRGLWWKLFADADLDHLEDLAGVGNQDLAVAAARFAEARAQVNIARADLFPQVEFDPSYVRQRTSLNAPENGAPAGTSPTFNTFTAQLQAGWEADLWGRVRRQVESARAQLAAGADDLEAVRLDVHAEVAMDYFALRSLDAECDLIERTAQAYRRSLELTINRRKGGIASDLDVAQAETQLRSTEAALPPLRLQRARLVHALAALCGLEAGVLELGRMPASLAEPPSVPLAVPSALLERRPDIAATERRMAAANAQVGVSQTAFYPHLRVNGLAGFQSVSASTWFDWPSRLWSVGPSLELPLFTGGRNRASLAYSRAAYDEAVASYRRVVLAAFQEVEDQTRSPALVARPVGSRTVGLEVRPAHPGNRRQPLPGWPDHLPRSRDCPERGPFSRTHGGATPRRQTRYRGWAD